MSDIQLPINVKGKDKIVMALIGLAGLAVFGWIGVTVLPILIAAATNTIIFVAELAAIIIVPLLIWDSRTAIYYKWANISRNLRRKLVADDPIGTLQTVISRFERKDEEIGELMTQAIAARKAQENSIKGCEQRRDKSLNLAKVATSDGERDGQLLAAERWDKTAEEMRPMLDLLSRTEAGMQGAKGVITQQLNNLRNQLEVLKWKYEAMMKSQTAVKKFKQFFSSNPDLEMLQMSLDEVELQANTAEAEIDGFLKNIAPLVQENDAQKRADALQAAEKFGKFLGTSSTNGSQPLITGTVVKEKVAK